MQFLRIDYYRDDRKCAHNLALWRVRIFGYIYIFYINYLYSLCFSTWNISPVYCTKLSPPPIAASRSHSHLTIGRTPLYEWSARRRDLYLTAQNSQDNRYPCPRRDRTRNLSKRVAADPQRWPCGHWDWLKQYDTECYRAYLCLS